MKRTGILASVILTLACSPLAWATSEDPLEIPFVPVGDPFISDSWSSHFGTTVGAVPHIDLIQAQVYAPFTFDNAVGFPGIKNFNVGGTPLTTWRQTADAGSYAIAQGSSAEPPSNIEMWFDLNFAGANPTSATLPPGSYVYMDIQAYQTIGGKETRVINESLRYGDPGVYGNGKWYAFATKNGTDSWIDISSYVGNIDYTGYHIKGLWDARSPVPEPLTMLGVFGGVAGVAGYIRRRRLA